jgi:hypothetical protein
MSELSQIQIKDVQSIQPLEQERAKTQIGSKRVKMTQLHKVPIALSPEISNDQKLGSLNSSIDASTFRRLHFPRNKP